MSYCLVLCWKIQIEGIYYQIFVQWGEPVRVALEVCSRGTRSGGWGGGSGSNSPNKIN